MNALASWNLWGVTVALLALEAAAIVGLAAWLQSRIRSATWQRIIWQACLLSLLAVTVLELTGLGRGFVQFRKPNTPHPVRSPAVDQASARLSAAWREQPRAKVAAKRMAVAPDPPTTAPPPLMQPAAPPATLSVRWVGALWLAGALVVLGKILLSQILLVFLRLRSAPVTSPELLTQAAGVARCMAWKRKIRLVEGRGLTGPMAFGILRPTIAIPLTFETDFNPPARQVALAHELAHLAKADPAWYILADMAAMLLWWHPLVWWARRRLHLSSEMVADESSLLVEDGPGVLAECLLQLGRCYAARQTLPGLGVTGLRSGLGRRVERLLMLPKLSRTRPVGVAGFLSRILGPATLASCAMLGGAWTMPLTRSEPAVEKETIMQNLHSAWKRSAIALTLVSVLGATEVGEVASAPADATTPTATTDRVLPADKKRETPDTGDRSVGSVDKRDSRNFDRRKVLETKLEEIVMDEVSYDNLPLSDVVRDLIEISRKRDPEERGVNFLMVNPTLLAVNAATGLPVTDPIDISAITIRIRPPLRHVRLVDVLDAITKGSDRPLKYSVKDYAVVFQFSEKWLVTAPLVAKTYRMDTNTFFSTLSHVFGVSSPGSGKPAPENQGKMLRSFFQELGIELEPPKTIYFNDRLGILMVRVAADEIDVIDAAVETLGGSEPVHGAPR